MFVFNSCLFVGCWLGARDLLITTNSETLTIVDRANELGARGAPGMIQRDAVVRDGADDRRRK